MTGTEAATFRLSADDMADAARLHQIALLTQPRPLLGMVAAVFVVASAIHTFTRLDGDGYREWLGVVAICLAGAAAYLALVTLVAVPRLARRQYREQRNLHEDHSAEITDQGYRVTSATGRSHIAWADYLRWTEDDRLVLLYVSSVFYQILPKRALTPDALHAMRKHLDAAGVPAIPSLMPSLTRESRRP